MKLLRLKINDPEGFRSLQNSFEVFFLREWDLDKSMEFNPYVLAGPNGSGKSNVLEALAAIFFHIERIHLEFRPQFFDKEGREDINVFDAQKSVPDAFELEYLLPIESGTSPIKYTDAHIQIVKEPGAAPKIKWINRNLFDEGSPDNIERKDIPRVLPDFVLAYSSGENEILSLPFFKSRFIQFDEYIDYLIRDDYYSQKPESRFINLDSTFTQSMLLSIFLMQEKETTRPILEQIGIEEINQFRVIIKNYVTVDLAQTPEYSAVAEKTDEDSNGPVQYKVNITKKLSGLIEDLKACSTAQYYDDESDSLYLDYWVNEATRDVFKTRFSDARGLFQAFQILLNLNLYTVSSALKRGLYSSDSLYVSETVPELASDQRVVRFKHFWVKKKNIDELILLKALSDGEHQFLHTLCMCTLFNSGRALFLLDEPETHFNPSWRASFITRLRQSFSAPDALQTGLNNPSPEMLITTHTPFLISDSRPENVLVFSNDENLKQVKVKHPNYNTLGASINKITMETFGKKETFGDYAKSKLDKFKVRAASGENIDNLIDEANKALGDSIEKLIFTDSLINKGKKS